MGWPIKVILFGIVVWAIPFALGMVIFPVVPPQSALFDTLMSVSAAFSVSAMSLLVFRNDAGSSFDKGLLVGSIWMVISIGLDLPLFVFGPEMMRMPAAEYMADIGLTYLIFPVIAAAIAAAGHK